METLLGLSLFGSVFAFYAVLVVLLIIFFSAEFSESGIIAASSFGCFLLLNYFWGNLPLFEIFTFKNIAIYIIAGFIFAIIRTYFKGRELKGDDKKYFDLKSAIFRWWFLFPVSAINWILGKLLKDLYDFVYSKIEKFFNSIFNAKK